MSYSFRSNGGGGSGAATAISRARPPSTSSPPQTPTIRVTSPVPDPAGSVLDIWDPAEVTTPEDGEEGEQQAKSSSSQYKDEMESSHSVAEDDGLKTVGESEESEEEEVSQVSAVTQVPLNEPSPDGSAGDAPPTPVADEAEEEEAVDSPAISPSRWHHLFNGDQMGISSNSKPIKRVQFNRSLSLVPASVMMTTGRMTDEPAVAASGRVRLLGGTGRRYSSMDGASSSSVVISSAAAGGVIIRPLVDLTSPVDEPFQHPHHHVQSAMLSPTPESALESAQSPDAAVQQQQLDPSEAESEADNKQDSGDMFDRLNDLKKDEELMSLAQDFVHQLLLKAQEEARRRGQQANSKSEQKSKMSLELQHVAVPKSGRSNASRKWIRRVRSILFRTLTCTCVPSHPNIQSPL